jgi:hypothetical protein
MTIRMRGVLSALLFLAFFVPTPSRAQDKIDKLTEENITTFIQETTEISAGQRADMSMEQVIEYLDRHIDKNGFFKSTMKYSMPEQPSQETTMNLDKKDFLKSIEAGSKAVNGYETEIDIRDIKISRDEKKATVQTTGREQASMPLDIDGQLTEVPVEGLSSCLQILMLSDEGMIQMLNANCTTEITLAPF